MQSTTDVERLQEWMTEKGYTLKSLAVAMDVRYNTLYRMLIERNTIADKFITRFIQVYGCDVAVEVFRDHLAPIIP